MPSTPELDEQLRRLLRPASDHERREPTSVERILDAALATFSARGIRSTTMTRLAQEAGVSREWLYRQFANREALVLAVAQREARRLIDGLAVRAFASDGFEQALTDAFVYSVEFLRDNELLQRVLSTESDLLTGEVLQDAAPVVVTAVAAGTTYLIAGGDLLPEQATTVAETLVRLVVTAVFVPSGALDLHDPLQLRRYAQIIVPGVLAAARAMDATTTAD